MGHFEKTVFISYRRANFPWALEIYQNLTTYGYDVFFDYHTVSSEDFEKVVLANIRARAHFLVVITSSTLEGCNDPNDWLRREIETALDEKRNIVPLFFDDINFDNPSVSKYLTGKLKNLMKYNGLVISSGFFDEAIERIRTRFFDIPYRHKLSPTSLIMGQSSTSKTGTPRMVQKKKSVKLKVFLCYSSHDKTIVRELYERLINDDFDAWLDEEKLLPGQDWDLEIEKAVEVSNAVIVCLSTNSFNKEGYVQRELRFVLDIAREKPEGTIFMIPVRLDDCQIPRRVRQYHYIDFFPVDNKNQAYKRIKESLELRARDLAKSE